jgi:hypothetical protein
VRRREPEGNPALAGGVFRYVSVTRVLGAVLLCFTAACSGPSPDAIREEKARLRASIEKFYADYKAATLGEKQIVADSLAWLDGPAISAPREQAVAGARRLMDRWAVIYFVPRYMHEQLRFDRYSSGEARAAHRKILDDLKKRYFEWHDFQRYAQYASETELHRTPPGRLPPQLQEFRSRLQSRAPAVDEIGPVLDAIGTAAP